MSSIKGICRQQELPSRGSKRKASAADGSADGPPRKRRSSENNQGPLPPTPETGSGALSSSSVSPTPCETKVSSFVKTCRELPQRGSKRKASAADGSPDRLLKKRRSSESSQVPLPPTPETGSGTPSSLFSSSSSTLHNIKISTFVKTSRADFESRYTERSPIGKGGFGSVFSGFRNVDNFPVAIKHIPVNKVDYTDLNVDGIIQPVILEAALMHVAAGGDNPQKRNPAVISLLDCYKLEKEVLLVMERPENCTDLHRFIRQRGSKLAEDEAKVILRQMVATSIAMHQSGVCHRDLKAENTLLDLDAGLEKVRVIDFGCGDFVKSEPFKHFSGTKRFTPPEWFSTHSCEAESSTVWQLGAMLSVILGSKYSPQQGSSGEPSLKAPTSQMSARISCPSASRSTQRSAPVYSVSFAIRGFNRATPMAVGDWSVRGTDQSWTSVIFTI